MSEHLAAKEPIYPVISLLSTILILVVGLLTAKTLACTCFLAGIWVVFLLFGYWRACLAVFPAAVLMCAVLAGITYAISGDLSATLAAMNRILAVCIAVIPGLAMPPVVLVRNLSGLHLPRMLILGMMITLNFFPLLGTEVRQVREAMGTRGAGSFLDPQIFYRAFLIPLVIQLVNISDTLALSVETRGFTRSGSGYTVYKTVELQPTDILFLMLVVLGAGLAVAL